MKIITWIAIIMVGGIAGLLAYCYYTENPKSYFKNYEEAKASGLMERGWIPTFIPKSSTEINEQHSLDTNRVWMSFKFSPDDTEGIKQNCTTDKTTQTTIVYKCVYLESTVRIELNSDGTGKLESKLDY
jgi:hypothetical protein